MGFNTTIVIRNDALGQIENDPDFGRKLVAAILELSDPQYKDTGVVVLGGAAHVVETHHADSTSIVTVAANRGVRHGTYGGWRHTDEKAQRDLVRIWGEKLGMKVSYKEPAATPAAGEPRP